MPTMNKKKVFAMAKGFRGRAKNCNRIARVRVDKALEHNYRNRKEKKREVRRLWIQQINAATREHDLAYSSFINYLNKSNIELNRKVLSELAITEPLSFRSIVEVCKASHGTN